MSVKVKIWEQICMFILDYLNAAIKCSSVKISMVDWVQFAQGGVSVNTAVSVNICGRGLWYHI